jgi:hypothetical protein
MDHSSSSITSNNGRQSWTVKLKGGVCSVDFRLEGKAQFTDGFTDIASLSPDGSFKLDVTDDGVRRQLEIEPSRDGLVRKWKLNGREAPYDAAAREWLAVFLIELDRRTAVGVDQRLPYLLKQGGVAAVIAETAHMPSDYARGVYYGKLAATTHLASAEVVRIFDQAAAMKTSDYYATELLKSLGARADAEARIGMFRLIQAMSEDYYRVEAVRQAIGRDKLSADELDLLVGLVPKMQSDYYKTELLKQILAAGNLDAAQRRQLAGSARDIGNDTYAAEFVKALAKGGELGPGGTRALIDAAATIESDYNLSEAIAAILADTALSEADLLAIVQATSATKSDYYRSEMLRKVLAHRAVTDRVRQVAIDATGGMSTYYREEVEKGAGKK